MNDMCYTPLIEGMTWSYSRVKCFECKHRWYLKYIKKEPERNMFYAYFGKLMHETIEKFYKKERDADSLYIDFLMQLASKKDVFGKPAAGTYTKYLDSAQAYLENFKPLPFDVVDTERKVEFDIGDKHFVGFIDYIGMKDGEYYIVDHKSRDLKPRSTRKNPTLKDKELDDMLVQLYLYSIPLIETYGKPPKALCFNCFKNGQFIMEPFVQEKYEEAQSKILEEIKNIENENEFEGEYDMFKCNYICGYKDICDYAKDGDRPLRRLNA